MRPPLSQYQIPAAPFRAVGFFGSGRPACSWADRPAYFGLADYVRQPILSVNVMFRISLGVRGVNYPNMVHFPDWEHLPMGSNLPLALAALREWIARSCDGNADQQPCIVFGK